MYLWLNSTHINTNTDNTHNKLIVMCNYIIIIIIKNPQTKYHIFHKRIKQRNQLMLQYTEGKLY